MGQESKPLRQTAPAANGTQRSTDADGILLLRLREVARIPQELRLPKTSIPCVLLQTGAQHSARCCEAFEMNRPLNAGEKSCIGNSLPPATSQHTPRTASETGGQAELRSQHSGDKMSAWRKDGESEDSLMQRCAGHASNRKSRWPKIGWKGQQTRLQVRVLPRSPFFTLGLQAGGKLRMGSGNNYP